MATDSTSRLLASYEALPYQGEAIPPTHPDSIAAMVRLRGLHAPDVTRCRVLDLGCATGGNLVSMAVTLPESSFVGVDLSPRQIETARDAAAALGLANVRFETLSIADIGPTFGTFDYIVSHGVYSWVPADVQRALLGVCARHLAPNGIAYVSYNTYPGWHLRGLVREMLLFHDRPELAPAERIARGRQLIEFIAASVPESERTYAALLREEFDLLSETTDTYFLHEELEVVNHPVYVREFAARAADAGLAFIGEALPSVVETQFSDKTRAELRRWASDDIAYEQYLDFLRGRSFRRSLLCHAGTPFERAPSAEAVKSLFLAARCTPDPPAPDAPDAGVEIFRVGGIAVTMNHPVVCAALHVLIDARPARLSFVELLARTRERLLGADSVVTEDLLADAMLRCALVTLVRLHSVGARCATMLSRRPRASELAQRQAHMGTIVTSLTSQNLELAALDRCVLAHADGTRDHDELLDVATAACARGDFAGDGLHTRTREELTPAVTYALQQFLINGLLVD